MNLLLRLFQKQSNESIQKGANGRLFIPKVGISVSVYEEQKKDLQQIVDNEDSCLLYEKQQIKTFTDHAGQSFRLLPKVDLDTEAYYYTKDNVLHLTCTGKLIGHNDRKNYLLYNGSIATKDLGTYCMTCCKSEDGSDIYLTYWEEVK